MLTFISRQKNKETEPIFEISYLGINWHDLVEMWGTDGGGHIHNKIYLVSYKQHEVTYM